MACSDQRNGAGIENGVVKINGVRLHYQVRGTGSHALVCIPAAFSTSDFAFGPQLEYFGREGSRFKIVSFDPRGYGHSRPVNRFEESENMYLNDAKDAHALMQALSLSRFSVLGWCDGGMAALILAAMFPESVLSVVVWGAKAYMTEKDVDLCKELRDIANWSPRYRDPLLKVYSEFELQELCSKWHDYIRAFQVKMHGDICTKELSKIVCRTLIVHGAKDPLIHFHHPEYLRNHVRDSKLEVMKEGKHNPHLQYHQEFNEIVVQFLEELD